VWLTFHLRGYNTSVRPGVYREGWYYCVRAPVPEKKIITHGILGACHAFSVRATKRTGILSANFLINMLYSKFFLKLIILNRDNNRSY